MCNGRRIGYVDQGHPAGKINKVVALVCYVVELTIASVVNKSVTIPAIEDIIHIGDSAINLYKMY